MTADLLSLLSFFAVLLGFAGLLGAQLYHLRTHFNSRQMAAAFAASGMVLLPPLSLTILPQWTGWLAAILVVVVYTLRPKALPARIWSPRFALGYNGLVMGIIAVWGIKSFSLPAVIIGSLAMVALKGIWGRFRTLTPP